MSTTTPVKSEQTLNLGGQMANGIMSNGGMLLVMQPAFVNKNSLQNKQGLRPVSQWWNGFRANALGILPAQGIAFAVNELTGTHLSKEYATFAAAAASAPVASYFERVSILQGNAQSLKAKLLTERKLAEANRVQTSIRSIIFQIHTVEGIRGAFRGTAPTLVRDLTWLKALFEGQDFVCDQMEQRGVENKWVRKAASGALVGGTAGAITNGVDLLKTRMQSTLGSNLSLRTIAIEVWTEEGATALAKGIVARTILCSGAMVCLAFLKPWLPQWYPDSLHK